MPGAAVPRPVYASARVSYGVRLFASPAFFETGVQSDLTVVTYEVE